MKKFILGICLVLAFSLASSGGAGAAPLNPYGTWTGNWTILKDYERDSSGLTTTTYPLGTFVEAVTVTLHPFDGTSYGVFDVLDPFWYDGVIDALTVSGNTVSGTAKHQYGSGAFYTAGFSGTVTSSNGLLRFNGYYDEEETPSSSVITSAGLVDLTQAAPVPEPSTLLLLGAGMAGIAALRLRKTK